MNKTTKALKLAEEALTGLTKNDSVNAYFADKRNKALAAIREALAEPVKQEPVMIVQVDARGIPEITWDAFKAQDAGRYELYAAPVQQVDLTCQEVTALIMEGAAGGGWQGFAERVQAAFKEKNK